jgi:hypothetical protein
MEIETFEKLPKKGTKVNPWQKRVFVVFGERCSNRSLPFGAFTAPEESLQ